MTASAVSDQAISLTQQNRKGKFKGADGGTVSLDEAAGQGASSVLESVGIQDARDPGALLG